MAAILTRRTFVGGVVAAAGLAAAGCGAEQRNETGESGAANGSAPAGGTAAAAPQLAAMTVYRDPSCGWCEAWAAIAGQAGFQVAVVDSQEMPAIKRRYGVPEELASCHTTIVGGYAVEGHVPIADVRRLLAARPTQIKGIAVPGMPLGSPGMEVPDGTRQPFEVMAFDAAGRITPFRA